MSDFACTVERLVIEPHPNADRLELARVGGYLSIVGKGQFKTGDLGVYIPEGAIVPTWMLEKMGLVGKLAGSEKNRVKAMRLRGILSQGLVYPSRAMDDGSHLTETQNSFDDLPMILHSGPGENLAADLGITKYVPRIPASMSGDVFHPVTGFLPKFDVENIKRYPHVLEKGESVIITEKVHGTCVIFGAIPSSYSYRIPDAIDGRVLVASKGICAQGLAFKDTPDNRAKNLYIRTLEAAGMIERVKALADANGAPIVLLGEIFGKGVQDLHYGAETAQFRLFDIYLPDGKSFASAIVTGKLADKYSIPHVPILYHGPWSVGLVEQFTQGGEWVSRIGKGADPIGLEPEDEMNGPVPENMREGIVIRASVERYDPILGRVVLKSVSDEYLTRGGEETEFQ